MKNVKLDVSDERFLEAYNNKDNKNIINSVLYKYSGTLDKDVLKSCGLTGLWRALQYHNFKYTTKFTSSVWKFTKWECDKYLKEKKRKEKNFKFVNLSYAVTKTYEDSPEPFLELNLEKFLNDEQVNIIKDKFIFNMTLSEIGKKLGFSKETIRHKLSIALSILKNEMVYNKILGKEKEIQE